MAISALNTELDPIKGDSNKFGNYLFKALGLLESSSFSLVGGDPKELNKFLFLEDLFRHIINYAA